MNPSRIHVQLQFKSAWRIRHGHWAEAELPFDPSKLEATWHFKGQPIKGIKLWGSLEGSEGQKIYQWGIKSRFAWLNPFNWNNKSLWTLKLSNSDIISGNPTYPISSSPKGSVMAKVDASPEEIETFSSTLDRFSKTLRDQMKQLNAAQKRLGETWRDQENERYAQEFEQAMRTLERFVQSSEQQVPQLRRKAQRLRDYLQQR